MLGVTKKASGNKFSVTAFVVEQVSPLNEPPAVASSTGSITMFFNSYFLIASAITHAAEAQGIMPIFTASG